MFRGQSFALKENKRSVALSFLHSTRKQDNGSCIRKVARNYEYDNWRSKFRPFQESGLTYRLPLLFFIDAATFSELKKTELASFELGPMLHKITDNADVKSVLKRITRRMSWNRVLTALKALVRASQGKDGSACPEAQQKSQENVLMMPSNYDCRSKIGGKYNPPIAKRVVPPYLA